MLISDLFGMMVGQEADDDDNDDDEEDANSAAVSGERNAIVEYCPSCTTR